MTEENGFEIECLVSSKVVARYLGVCEAYVRTHRDEIPGALQVSCGARQIWRFDLAKVKAWQQQQEAERRRPKMAGTK